jgi:hypothetical protein
MKIVNRFLRGEFRANDVRCYLVAETVLFRGQILVCWRLEPKPCSVMRMPCEQRDGEDAPAA